MAKRQDPPCVNLKTEFGHLYRVTYEESYYAQYGENARREDPWLMIIRCRQPKNTHIGPWGELGSETELCVAFGAPSKNAILLAREPGFSVLQDSSDGMTLGFQRQHADRVFSMVKPYRRRRMTDEQRAAAAERLRRHWDNSRQVSPKTAQKPPQEKTGPGTRWERDRGFYSLSAVAQSNIAEFVLGRHRIS